MIEFSPSIYEHAAALIEKSPWETSRDPDLLFNAHAEAYRRYRHSPIMVGIDVYNLEPEAYGARIHKPAGNSVPTINEYIISTINDFSDLKNYDLTGSARVPMVIDAGRRLARAFPEADIRIPVSGFFSIASSLMGIENLLCEIMLNPQEVTQALQVILENQIKLCEEIYRHDLSVTLFESGTAPPLLSPEQFHEIEFPLLKNMIARLRNRCGKPVPCIIGGNTEPILDDILATGTKYVICPFETDQETFMKKVWRRSDVFIRVNMNVGIISKGSWEALKEELDRIVKLITGRENACVGTGVLPYETPSLNIIRAKEYLSKIALTTQGERL